MYSDVYIYVPSMGQIIRIAEGNGMNLLEEDIQDGYVDYIYYDQYERDIDLPEVDGGQIMLDTPFREIFKNTEECIPRVLEMAYGSYDIPYITLK